MNHHRRNFLKQLLSVGAVSPFVLKDPSNAHAASKPNIVLIVADDLGYGDLSSYGAPDIHSPVIDKIAKKGVKFTNFYSNAPECTPTRTALLTGRYQHRVGGLECAIGVGNVGRYDDAIRLRETNDLGLPASLPTLPQLLKSAGYNTACCGKWHLGYETKFHPHKHGFDHFFGVMGGNSDYFFHAEASGLHVLYEEDRMVRRKGHLTDLFTDDALSFLDKQNKENPFFLYLPHTVPHSPYQALEDESDTLLTEEEWNKGTRETYIKMVEHMDRRIGDVMQSLEDKGLMENTIVIFMSDNGANSKGRNNPFNGYKGNVYEGGIHVPCMVRWDGMIEPNSTSEQVCITMDITRSLCRIAGVEMPPPYGYDGIDIIKHVNEEIPDTARTLFWRARRGENTRKAVRDGDMKYIHLKSANGSEEHLFDLKNDPAEKNDLLETEKQAVASLKQKLSQWEVDVKAMR